MEAIILSIGDELVLGQTVDTNSAYMSAQLARRGIATRYHMTVPDDQPAIAAAIDQCLGQAGLLIISGGLGPTEDDLTRQALADALGQPLVLHEPSVEHIRRMFSARSLSMPKRNQVQAMHPRTTQIVPNPWGTAPGIRAQVKGTDLFVLPGVPAEMKGLFESVILPELQSAQQSRQVILTAKINSFGLGESTVAERLGSLMSRDRNPKVGTTVADAIVSVRVRSEFDVPDDAARQLEETVNQVIEQLGPVVFGRDEQSLQETLVSELAERGLTVSTAESCTGGLLGKMITDVPGASRVYRAGWVTYSNEAKVGQLQVEQQLLDTHGAVSGEVACAMAVSALKLSGADLGVAITGIAGPNGGTEDKPVGTVWIALAHRRDGAAADPIATDALQLQLGGDRQQIRDRAARAACQMLRLHVLGHPIDLMQWGRHVPSPPRL